MMQKNERGGGAEKGVRKKKKKYPDEWSMRYTNAKHASRSKRQNAPLIYIYIYI